MNIRELKTLMEHRISEEHPFVTYRKPGADSLVTWICDSAEFMTDSDMSEPGFVFCLVRFVCSLCLLGPGG